jgi:hypothetical protein
MLCTVRHAFHYIPYSSAVAIITRLSVGVGLCTDPGQGQSPAPTVMPWGVICRGRSLYRPRVGILPYKKELLGAVPKFFTIIYVFVLKQGKLTQCFKLLIFIYENIK